MISKNAGSVPSELGAETVKERALQRVQKIIDRDWPLPTIRVIASVWLAFIGTVLAGLNFYLVLTIGLLTAFAIALTEYLFIETSGYVRKRAEQKAREEFEGAVKKAKRRARSAEVGRAASAAAEAFLSKQLTKATGLVSSVSQASQREREQAAVRGLKKVESINEALGALCNAHSALASRSLDVEPPDAWFQATYMEVQLVNGVEKLVYVGWHTRGGEQPRSMVEGRTFERGEKKLAVAAWNTKRAAIKNFKLDGGNWTDNYQGQSGKYKSMVSVPVLRPEGDAAHHVIGVITVGTPVEDYFGMHDDTDAEERAKEMADPYCTYIAFISVTHHAIKKVLGASK